MRATSSPSALPVATAVLLLPAAVLLPPAVPSTALAERWLRPVPGEVARPFAYTPAAPFAAGAHRGADLAAGPGTPVRSSCAGTVVHAGPVARQGLVVSVRCRGRRVTYLPLARTTVRPRSRIRAGAPIGTVAAGHGGLHVGVRRAADRFAYEDPLALFAQPGRPRAPAPLAVRRPPSAAPRSVPRTTAPRPLPPIAAPAPARLADAPRAGIADVAPWPVWAGLGALLTGAAGSGALAVRRRRTSRPSHPVPAGRRRQESPA